MSNEGNKAEKVSPTKLAADVTSTLSTPSKPSMPRNGVDNAAAKFDDVSLSNNTPISPSIQQPKETEALDSYRTKRGSLTMREYFSVGILFFVNLLNYMDRFTVAGVLTEVQTFHDIKDDEAGLLQTVFIVFFMIFAPLCSYFGDRYNRKLIMIVGLVIWVSAVLASTFIPRNNFWPFMLLRGVVGIGEASYSVIAPTIIADMFTSVIRSRVLMLFYFAIPVGSGLGFIVGAKVASYAQDWRWGVRVTPVFGLASILAIIFILQEPERGKAEKDQGAENVDDQPTTGFLQDLLYLLKNKTYIWSTIGYTAVVFVTGTLSWWTAASIEYATAAKYNYTDARPFPPAEKSNISLIFGAIMTLGGLIGVSLGTIFAQLWKRGQACFRGHHNVRADPLVCMIGSLVACPFMFLGLHMINVELIVGWIAIFISVTFLCLNWAVNVDMLLAIVLPKRRSVATGMQILVSHLFGDASGPYIVGVLSNWILGGKKDPPPGDHFNALLIAFYIPTVLLIVSAICFGISAWTLVGDKEKFDIAMGYKVSSQKVTIINAKGLDNDAFETNKQA